MSESIKVRSRFGNYNVDFGDDYLISVKEAAEQGSFFIVDAIVHQQVQKRMGNTLHNEKIILAEADEKEKTVEACLTIIRNLVGRGIRRNSVLVAIGGGYIQDITGFIASILYRGIEWKFVPTTLLAQADSCIGSKTSINLDSRKNLLGTFYPPSAVLIDTQFLHTLPESEIRSGIGEMLHYFIYANSPHLKKLAEHYDHLLVNRKAILEYIRASLSIKVPVVEADELDQGERNKFNYGHTFGHAIEAFTDYQINHGQAVTVGMDIANYLSMQMGMMSQKTFQELHGILLKNFPSAQWESFSLDVYMDALSKDKKNIENKLGCILAREPGALEKKYLPLDATVKNILHDYFDGVAQGAVLV